MYKNQCFAVFAAACFMLVAMPAFAETTSGYVGTWYSILPAAAAIVLAFLTRQVFIALFVGVWLGAWLVNTPSLTTLLPSMLDVLETYLIRALVPENGSTDHMAIVLFTLLTGGMIGIISRNGGMDGIVQRLSRFANTPKRGQTAAYGMGFLIFFDDYANTLIVGKTMQPLMDRLKISREKLAFLVDSTAAPLAAIAIATTWIGFQVSLMNGAMPEGVPQSGYELFVSSVPYSFYPILMLVFIAILIKTGRDFGPMLTAEKAARADEKSLGYIDDELKADDEKSPRAWLAMVPILTLVAMVVGSLFYTGSGETWRDVLGSADPFKAMLWASLSALMVALVTSIFSGALSVGKTVAAMERGFTPMLMAVMILAFAWAIADVNAALSTADYVVSMLGDSLAAEWLPISVFVIAAITAFATGTSWGTMGILIPLILPLGWQIISGQGDPADSMHILYAAVASVMAGAVWGDHCSPISDTTILSSLASNCSHIEHVRTQLPYAMTVAGVGMAACIIPASFGLHWALCLVIGSAVLYAIVKALGKQA